MIKVESVYLITRGPDTLISISARGEKGPFSIMYDLTNKGIVRVGADSPGFGSSACFTKDEAHKVCDIIDEVDLTAKTFHSELESLVNKGDGDNDSGTS